MHAQQLSLAKNLTQKNIFNTHNENSLAKKNKNAQDKKDDKHIELHLLRFVCPWMKCELNWTSNRCFVCQYVCMEVCVFVQSICPFRIRDFVCIPDAFDFDMRGENVCFLYVCVRLCVKILSYFNRFESKLSKYSGMLWFPSTHAHTANPFNHSVKMCVCFIRWNFSICQIRYSFFLINSLSLIHAPSI